MLGVSGGAVRRGKRRGAGVFSQTKSESKRRNGARGGV